MICWKNSLTLGRYSARVSPERKRSLMFLPLASHPMRSRQIHDCIARVDGPRPRLRMPGDAMARHTAIASDGRRLSADEQVIDARRFKALEKASDHGWRADSRDAI